MATHRIRRFDPVQVAKVTGVLYGLMGLVFVPILILFALVSPQAASFRSAMWIVVIAIPVFYACIGALFSLIAAALYNLVAGWVGGIAVEVE